MGGAGHERSGENDRDLLRGRVIDDALCRLLGGECGMSSSIGRSTGEDAREVRNSCLGTATGDWGAS